VYARLKFSRIQAKEQDIGSGALGEHALPKVGTDRRAVRSDVAKGRDGPPGRP